MGLTVASKGCFEVKFYECLILDLSWPYETCGRLLMMYLLIGEC
jgi:hypothetical protein